MPFSVASGARSGTITRVVSGDLRRYAETAAPADVVHTLEWLEAAGLTLTQEQGTSTFGMYLLYSAPRAWVRVVCDRSQWFMDVAPRNDERPGSVGAWRQLDVVLEQLGWDLKATSGQGQRDRHGNQLQFPDGVSWLSVVPEVVEWASSIQDAPPADEVQVGILAERQGRLTVVEMVWWSKVRVFNVRLDYDRGDGYATVWANVSPGVDDEESPHFRTDHILSITDPETDEVLFTRA